MTLGRAQDQSDSKVIWGLQASEVSLLIQKSSGRNPHRLFSPQVTVISANNNSELSVSWLRLSDGLHLRRHFLTLV